MWIADEIMWRELCRPAPESEPKHYTTFFVGILHPSGVGPRGGSCPGCSLVPRSTPANRFDCWSPAATTLGGLESDLSPLESPGSSRAISSLAIVGMLRMGRADKSVPRYSCAHRGRWRASSLACLMRERMRGALESTDATRGTATLRRKVGQVISLIK